MSTTPDKRSFVSRAYVLTGDCGVKVDAFRLHIPTLGTPMPHHICRNAAYNICCTVTGVRSAHKDGSAT